MPLPTLLLICIGVVAAAGTAVRHRVPDVTNGSSFIESDSIQCLLSLHFNTIGFQCNYSLAVVVVVVVVVVVFLIKSFFLLNDISSTPSVLPDSS